MRKFLTLVLFFVFPAEGANDTRFDECINSLKLPDLPVNEQILNSYAHFRKTIEGSSYYQLHEAVFPSYPGSIHPVLEYAVFLTSYTADDHIAGVVDYLIKTAGPFGFSCREADVHETFIYTVAASAVAKVGKTYDCAPASHQRAIQSIQKNGYGHDPKAEQEILNRINKLHFPQLGLREPSERFKSFVAFVQDPTFFNPLDTTIHDGKRPSSKYFLLNDFFITAYLLNLTPSLTRDRLLYKEWGMSNSQLERDHNYVQLLFPIFSTGMGDGVQAPRLTKHLLTLLKEDKNGALKEMLQDSIRVSFARMANFWGQQLTTDGRIVRLDVKVGEKDWEKNWSVDHTHNHLRMTRFLIHLLSMGLTAEYEALSKYLEKVMGAVPGSPYKSFWAEGKIPAKIALEDRITPNDLLTP